MNRCVCRRRVSSRVVLRALVWCDVAHDAMRCADACAQSLVPIEQHSITRYEIGRVVGHGTYSSVKLAKDKETHKSVVIKILTKSNLSVLFPREVLMLLVSVQASECALVSSGVVLLLLCAILPKLNRLAQQMSDVKWAVKLVDVVNVGDKPALVFPYIEASECRRSLQQRRRWLLDDDR